MIHTTIGDFVAGHVLVTTLSTQLTTLSLLSTIWTSVITSKVNAVDIFFLPNVVNPSDVRAVLSRFKT